MIAAFKVLVADDEPAAVKAICLILQKSCPEFEVVATACDGEDAYKKSGSIFRILSSPISPCR